MKSMFQNMIVCALVAVFVSLLARGEFLMPCPDYEKMVLHRVLMCPSNYYSGGVKMEFDIADYPQQEYLDSDRVIYA